MGDLLGRSRNLGMMSAQLPPDHYYGRPSSLLSKSSKDWGVAETIRVRPTDPYKIRN